MTRFAGTIVLISTLVLFAHPVVSEAGPRVGCKDTYDWFKRRYKTYGLGVTCIDNCPFPYDCYVRTYTIDWFGLIPYDRTCVCKDPPLSSRSQRRSQGKRASSTTLTEAPDYMKQELQEILEQEGHSHFPDLPLYYFDAACEGEEPLPPSIPALQCQHAE